jgi:hypothetical protein
LEEEFRGGLLVAVAGHPQRCGEVLWGGVVAGEVGLNPVALGRLPDGREILVHCPDRYNVLRSTTWSPASA